MGWGKVVIIEEEAERDGQLVRSSRQVRPSSQYGTARNNEMPMRLLIYRQAPSAVMRPSVQSFIVTIYLTTYGDTYRKGSDMTASHQPFCKSHCSTNLSAEHRCRCNRIYGCIRPSSPCLVQCGPESVERKQTNGRPQERLERTAEKHTSSSISYALVMYLLTSGETALKALHYVTQEKRRRPDVHAYTMLQVNI